MPDIWASKSLVPIVEGNAVHQRSTHSCSGSKTNRNLRAIQQSYKIKGTRYFFKSLDQWEKRWVESGSIDRSTFKLFLLRFSTKSMQVPSCERPKTSQQPLFLSFEIKNCFQIGVLRWSFMKKSGKLACHMVNWKITIDS